MTVSDRLRKRRLELGLTAAELGDRVGKNKTTIYRYESGEIEKVPYSVMVPLAKALNTTPAYLMGWEDENDETIPCPRARGGDPWCPICCTSERVLSPHVRG